MSTSEFDKEKMNKMVKDLKNAEREAVLKDKQISELLARLREYEMGEYGLSEAVTEIKECKRLLRLRDREIESLADQLNASKLHVLKLTEKLETLQLGADVSNQQSLLSLGKAPPRVKKTKKVQKPKVEDIEEKPTVEDKVCQCYISVYPLNSLKQISSAEIQNEKLRIELRKVCEEANELLTLMEKDHKKSNSEYEAIINKLKENLEVLEMAVLKAEPLSSKTDTRFKEKEEVKKKYDLEDCYKSVLVRIEREDIEVQEIFHELANQIKVLKQNQTTLVRQCQALSDYGIQVRKENEKLRRAYSGVECTKSECVANRNNIVKLVDLVTEFLKEISHLRDLLEVSHHQTKALESVCFAKETELRAAMEQLILFQIQSDERLLLGKLALKVLQLQFTNAACTYELKKHKLDREALQKWYAALLKDHEENEIKLSTAYAKAHTKVKYLMDALQDVGRRCTEAVSLYEQNSM